MSRKRDGTNMKQHRKNDANKKKEKRSSAGSERSPARGAQEHTNQQDKRTSNRRKTKERPKKVKCEGEVLKGKPRRMLTRLGACGPGADLSCLRQVFRSGPLKTVGCDG